MHTFLERNLAHFIAIVVLVSRVGDIGTTYLVTPTLTLEANSLVRRFGWKFGAITLLVALVPYYSIPAGIMIATASLLVAASNGSKVLLARSLGEEEYARITHSAIATTPVFEGLFYLLLPSLFYGVLGATMLFFFHDPYRDWGFYFTLGVLGYASAMAFWYTVRFFRVRSEESKKVQT